MDAHPLVREYFAEQLQRTHPHAFRDAHSRLFDHLCNSTEHQPDTLLALQPLYQAVTHGCLGGRHQEACDKVYVARILRGMGHDGFFSTKKLGAIGADLGAVVAFFTVPWSRLSPNLTAPAQAWLLSVAAFNLRALGRLTEAIEPMRAGMDRRVETEDWNNAAISASNRSELEVTLGLLSEAVADGRRAIAFADRSDDAFEQMSDRTTAADALHQAGDRAAALDLFAEAERMQVERQPEIPLLYSLSGFRYADLLLAPAERAAWKRVSVQPLGAQGPAYPESPKGYTPTALASCDEATRRAEEVFRWRRGTIWNSACDTLIDIALDHLTLARAALSRALLTPGDATALAALPAQISQALTDLRETNMFDQLPKALLTAAFHAGTVGGQPEAAERYLAEAQLIAERGPMPLYLADVHLHRARLFGPLPPADRAKFPHLNPRADLAEARRLIEHHGYARRKEELEDAEAAAGNW